MSSVMKRVLDLNIPASTVASIGLIARHIGQPGALQAGRPFRFGP